MAFGMMLTRRSILGRAKGMKKDTTLPLGRTARRDEGYFKRKIGAMSERGFARAKVAYVDDLQRPTYHTSLAHRMRPHPASFTSAWRMASELGFRRDVASGFVATSTCS